MSIPSPPAWYPDPSDSRVLRWWDGTRWTAHTAPLGGQQTAPANRPIPGPTVLAPTVNQPTPAPPASALELASKRRRGWVILGIVLGAMVLGGILGRFTPWLLVLVFIGLLVAGGYVLIRGAAPRLLLKTRPAGLMALGAAVLLVIGAGAANATPQSPTASQVGFVSATPDASSTASASPSPTPTPTPTPVTTTELVEEESAIAFERQTVDSANLDVGVSQITTAGVNGTLRTTYKVTYLDGEEVSREMVEEIVITAPVAEVTSRGTRQPAPPPKAAPAPFTGSTGGNCAPNYSGACVPIASDVDCAGGSGDGPAYLNGSATVAGSDIYDLDRDGNGIACD